MHLRNAGGLPSAQRKETMPGKYSLIEADGYTHVEFEGAVSTTLAIALKTAILGEKKIPDNIILDFSKALVVDKDAFRYFAVLDQHLSDKNGQIILVAPSSNEKVDDLINDPDNGIGLWPIFLSKPTLAEALLLLAISEQL